jgi:hypothetical protein
MHDSIAASVDMDTNSCGICKVRYMDSMKYIAATIRGCNRMHALFEPSREATTSAFFFPFSNTNLDHPPFTIIRTFRYFKMG